MRLGSLLSAVHLLLCLVGGLEIISSCAVIIALGAIEADSPPFCVTRYSFYLDLRSQTVG